MLEQNGIGPKSGNRFWEQSDAQQKNRARPAMRLSVATRRERTHSLRKRARAA